MLLPNNLSQKINSLVYELKNVNLKEFQKDLTYKYKNQSGSSKTLIDGKNDSIIYAVSRMPATYSVIYSLLTDLINQGYLENINSISDFGSGTGACYFVCKDIFENSQIELFEKNENMIETFSKLCNREKSVNKIDLITDKFNFYFDLAISSYVLSELTENDRINVFKKILNSSKKYVLIIDTGTPNSYKNMMKLKEISIDMGYNVLAPCKCEKCSLADDYCQFYARVERSGFLRQAKNGTLPYEDEKYFYLFLIKNEFNGENLIKFSKSRVIRRPKIMKNQVELKLCTTSGVQNRIITRKDKELYKNSKKIKINYEF